MAQIIESPTITTSTIAVRGYSIPVSEESQRVKVLEYICGNIVNFLVQNNVDIQFRWAQTVSRYPNQNSGTNARDVFAIDNLNVGVYSNGNKYTVISEDFESSTTTQRLV